jgi:hypothetical protein
MKIKKHREMPGEPWFTIMILAYGTAIMTGFATLLLGLASPPFGGGRGMKAFVAYGFHANPRLGIGITVLAALSGVIAQNLEKNKRKTNQQIHPIAGKPGSG